jgi:transcriptional regulator with XRE-family HTH domain
MKTQSISERIATIDPEIGQRLHQFRKKHVDPVLRKAAEKIGTSHPWLSQMENGKRPVNGNVIMKLVMDYDLNTDWLSTGNGDMKTSGPGKYTAATSLTQAFKEIDIIQKAFKMTTANLNHALKILEQQDKKITSLQKRMDKMEDGK